MGRSCKSRAIFHRILHFTGNAASLILHCRNWLQQEHLGFLGRTRACSEQLSLPGSRGGCGGAWAQLEPELSRAVPRPAGEGSAGAAGFQPSLLDPAWRELAPALMSRATTASSIPCFAPREQLSYLPRGVLGHVFLSGLQIFSRGPALSPVAILKCLGRSVFLFFHAKSNTRRTHIYPEIKTISSAFVFAV